MKRFVTVLILIIVCFIPVKAENIENDISKELGLERAAELIPDSVDEKLSPSATPSENGLSFNKILQKAVTVFFDSLQEEIPFFFSVMAVLIISSIIMSVVDSTHSTLLTVLRFSVSAVTATLIISHIENAYTRAWTYVEELSTFMTGLLPFLGSVSAVGGELSTSAVQSAALMWAVNILRSFMSGVTMPLCRAVIALSVAGYISGVPLGTLAELISGVISKTVAICCGIMCAILYFQNTVTTVTDSLALRSVKLMAGSFIPVVGSFVSEASGTLISGVRLVKSTFGVFAICVLIYISIRPILNFSVVKLSAQLSSVLSKLLGCYREASVFSQLYAVYNMLSAVMIASACFFVFSIAVFIKSEVS